MSSTTWTWKGWGGWGSFFSVPLSFKVTVKAPDYMSQYQCRKGDLNKALFTRTQTKRTGSTHGTLFKHQAICLKNPVLVMFQARADIETRSKNKKKVEILRLTLNSKSAVDKWGCGYSCKSPPHRGTHIPNDRLPSLWVVEFSRPEWACVSSVIKRTRSCIDKLQNTLRHIMPCML